jgi:hypothetical protein
MALQPTTLVTNVSEFEEVAKSKLPKMVYDYYASGAEDQWTLKENRHAFERIRCVGWSAGRSSLFCGQLGREVLLLFNCS